ncbi:Zinc finger protein rotund, partial [Frankliniella fusca]
MSESGAARGGPRSDRSADRGSDSDYEDDEERRPRSAAAAAGSPPRRGDDDDVVDEDDGEDEDDEEEEDDVPAAPEVHIHEDEDDGKLRRHVASSPAPSPDDASSSSSSSAGGGGGGANNNNNNKQFLLPAEVYKHLLTNAVLGRTEKLGSYSPSDNHHHHHHHHHDDEDDDEDDELPAAAPAFPGVGRPLLSPASPPEEKAFVWSQADGGQQAPGAHPGPPKGGAGGGPNGQGLVHWMSVMAEHMNSAGGSDGVHYMWNGAVE